MVAAKGERFQSDVTYVRGHVKLLPALVTNALTVSKIVVAVIFALISDTVRNFPVVIGRTVVRSGRAECQEVTEAV